MRRKPTHRHRWKRDPEGGFRCTGTPRCRARTEGCDKCGEPMNHTPSLDKPGPPGEDLVWLAYRCKNGHVEFDPLD